MQSKVKSCDQPSSSLATTLKQLAKDKGKEFGDFFWQHLSEIAVDHEEGVFAGTNDLVERIGGKPPMTLDAFVEKHRRELTS